MARGLFFGLTTVDICNLVPTHPAANQKVKAERQEICAGGPAANAAVAFAAFGNDAHLCSGLGRHPTAQLAAADLNKHQVTIHDLADWGDQPPIISSILIDSCNGDRCIVYTDPGKRRLVAGTSWKRLLNGCSVILFDGFYLEQAVIVAEHARGKHIATVLDGGSWKDGLERLLPLIDHAICSADFRPPGCGSLENTLDYLAGKGIAKSAVSRGPESIITCSDGRRQCLETDRVKAVDTLGAGDILHGAFCHFIGSEPFEQSLRLASRTASLSCCHFGTRDWINHLNQ